MSHSTATDVAAALVLACAGLHAIVTAARTDLPWRRWRVAAMLICRLGLLAAVAAWFFEAEIRLPRTTDRVELLVLADQSASIGPEGRETVRRWIGEAEAAASQRGGWIATRWIGTAGGRATPLAEALRDARLAFPGRGEKRLLVVSDGCATTGDPLAQLPQLAEDEIKVCAAGVPRPSGESLVAELNVPPAAWRSVPLPVEVVLQADVAGPCRLLLSLDGKEPARQQVVLRGGRTALSLPVVFESEGLHRVEVRAEFATDRIDWNNRAAALVEVPLAPRVVVISEAPAAAHPLRAALAANGLTARVVAPKDFPARFSADCVVLDNVKVQSLGDQRLAALEEYARGGGAILFTGGRRAYGGGGYRATPLEPAFPVHLDPDKDYPPFALVVVLDNSWSMNEALGASVGKIDIAKEIAAAAVDGLHEGDWLSLVSFDAEYHNIIAPTKVKDLEPAKYEISRIGAFGMTNILGGLTEAARILRGIDAAYKHVVLISDGRETEVGTDYSLLLKSLERMRISLSTIGVGTNVNAKLLNTLAYAGKGRYYHTTSIKEIPAVALREAKGPENQLTVEMPLPPKKLAEDPALAGVDVAAWPPLAGYNRSRPRLHAWTPLAISPKSEPLLARMRYGRGQTAAFLSSATPPWAGRWIDEKPADYVRFWRQLVLSLLPSPCRTLRPQTDYEDGQPVFDFPAWSDLPAGEVRLNRLSAGKVETMAAGPEPIRVMPDTDALLCVSKGKQIDAFSWSRTYGREFADPAQGEAMLKTLCARTGGIFQPRAEDLFANGRHRTWFALGQTAWLVAAVLLLLAEILLRRLPALKSLAGRVGRTVQGRLEEPSCQAGLLAALVLCLAVEAGAMEVRQQGTRLIVTGTNFRYTWDARRGGELAAVEQPGPPDGWWVRGMPGYRNSPWQRINSCFAWKSLDTIPALSFSTKRMAYYSGEAVIACANADKSAKIRILRQSADEVCFETESSPKILENTRLPVPWKVKQRARVFDSGIVLIGFEITLPEGESYELDWAAAGVHLDDSLYKEPSPERQARFSAGCAVPGDPQELSATWKAVIDDRKKLPLDIDVKPEQTTVVHKPLLFGWAAYDRTHQKGSAACGYAECCLAEARSLVGTKEDFGSQVMTRPASGMSPVPTEVGSMRDRPCFGVSWNLFDGETRGLTEPLKYENTLALAVGARKRSSRPGDPADDRNVLLGARVYYARERLPSAGDVRTMAAEGCDTLILGPAWRGRPADTAAVAAAAHAAGMRLGAAVALKDARTLVQDGTWFSKLFEKDRDGLLVSGASFLDTSLPAGPVEVPGEKLQIAHDGPYRANAAAVAVCMRALRGIVGRKGFLIGDPGAFPPGLLSLAECDAHASADLDSYRWGSPQDRCQRRYRAGAGWAPITESLPQPWIALAAMYADTPLVLWPPKDKQHLAWWELCRRLPRGGLRVESDLLAIERRFTVTGQSVHGTLFDGGDGRAVLLLAAEKDGAAQLRFTVPVSAVKTLDGKEVPVAGSSFDAGTFSAWEVKGYEVRL